MDDKMTISVWGVSPKPILHNISLPHCTARLSCDQKTLLVNKDKRLMRDQNAKE